MTTAGERLAALSLGSAGHTAGERLRAIAGGGSGSAGALLVAYSKLSTGTAAQHLLAVVLVGDVPMSYPGGGLKRRSRAKYNLANNVSVEVVSAADQLVAPVRNDDEEVVLLMVALFARGLFDG